MGATGCLATRVFLSDLPCTACRRRTSRGIRVEVGEARLTQPWHGGWADEASIRAWRTRIKICGIRDEASLTAAAEAGAPTRWALCLWRAPRYIRPEEAWKLAGLLPPMVATVGLYQNPGVDDFAEVEQVCPTTLTQLHGNERDQIVEMIGPDLIKAVQFDPETIAERLRHYDAFDEVNAILIDGSAGGEGSRSTGP